LQRLSDALSKADARGISLSVEIAVTGERDRLDSTNSSIHGHDDDYNEKSDIDTDYIQGKGHESYVTASRNCHSASSSDTSSAQDIDHLEDGYQSVQIIGEPESISPKISYSYGRPDIAAFIRRPVEATGGETSVAVCAGKSLVSTVRNAVASLSDERAVHKGTGAQGIYLHVEEYSF
jgi:hypothetical protein